MSSVSLDYQLRTRFWIRPSWQTSLFYTVLQLRTWTPFLLSGQQYRIQICGILLFCRSVIIVLAASKLSASKNEFVSAIK